MIFTGKIEVYLEKISKEAIQYTTSQSKVSINTVDLFTKFDIRKHRVSQVRSELYYTIISHFIHNDELIGICWEIYELHPIKNIYHKKNDPLRYWRRNWDGE